jgi:hypothetical protein
MVKDLRTKGAITLLGSITIFFIFIYVIRFFFLKEGFQGQGVPTEAQMAFLVEAAYVPMGMSFITDPEAPVQKLIREAAAMGNDAARNLNIGGTDTINYSSILNTLRNKYNEDPITSTAYKVYKSVKFPKPPIGQLSQAQARALEDEMKAAVSLALKKLHKALPSYPFSVQAMDILKKDSESKKPTMDECKKVFKCSNVESVPANI